jgi:rRNA-processing protein FCF1
MALKNVFLDTNVYLSFYSFTSEDLEELKKLSVVLNKNIKLFTTDQVVNEFKRNRENKIKDALHHVEKQDLPSKYPQICRAYSEYQELRDCLKKYSTIKQKMIEKIRFEASGNKLAADLIINNLFASSNVIKTDRTTIENACIRVKLGNPPGKSNSHGDAVNWELLLSNVPDKEDLFFITDDNDYFSAIDPSKLSDFLSEEWEQRKKSKIYCYRRLSEFLNIDFPDIKLAADLEKQLAVREFINSSNFAITKAAIRKLSKYGDFSTLELSEIVAASISNNQIYWIKDDSPVKSFLFNLVNGREDELDPTTYEEFNDMYEYDQYDQEPEDSDD